MSSCGVDVDRHMKPAESEIHCWFPNGNGDSSSAIPNGKEEEEEEEQMEIGGIALCLGTGRFLRSVLVPALVGAGLKPFLIQTRGRNFMEYMAEKSSTSSDITTTAVTNDSISYEVDTVLPDGTIVTDHVPCYGVFSVGKAADKEALWDWLPTLKNGYVSHHN
jgi:hypothetical protein